MASKCESCTQWTFLTCDRLESGHGCAPHEMRDKTCNRMRPSYNKDIKETKLSALMINALRRNCMKFCNSGTKRTVYNREVYIFEEVSEKRCSIMFVNLVPKQKTIYTHFD